MKIYTMEIETDLGRRVVQLAAPLEVEARGDMPPNFRSLTELLWGIVCEAAANPEAYAAPKVEA